MTTSDVAPYRPPAVAVRRPVTTVIPAVRSPRLSAAGVAAGVAAGAVVGCSAVAVGTGLTVGGDWPAWSLAGAGVSTVVALLAAAGRGSAS